MRASSLFILLLATASGFASPDPAEWASQTLGPVLSGGENSATLRSRIEKQNLAPELRRLLLRERKESAKAGEPLRLDFDWILAAQEIPDSFTWGQVRTGENRIVVPAILTFGDEKVVVRYVLVPDHSTFLIENVLYESDDLLMILSRDSP